MPDYSLYGPYKGEYYTILQLHEITGLSYATIRSRMFRGWTIDQIIEIPLIAGHSRKYLTEGGTKYTYNGKQYTSEELSQLDSCQVPLLTLQGRIKAGWDIDRAVETPLCHTAYEKQPISTDVIDVMFTSHIAAVLPDMQPELYKPYKAEVGLWNRPAPDKKPNYFIIKLNNGKPLIVYENEFQKI